MAQEERVSVGALGPLAALARLAAERPTVSRHFACCCWGNLLMGRLLKWQHLTRPLIPCGGSRRLSADASPTEGDESGYRFVFV